MTERLFVYGGTVLTLNPNLDTLESGVIEVINGKIEKIYSEKKFHLPKGAIGVDASNCLVMPGLINTHTHTAMNVLRGIADDLPLHEWLFGRIFPLERKFAGEDFVYWGTLLACAEMIRFGVTTFNDMYYFENSAAKAAHEAGLRMMAGQCVADVSQVEDKSSQLATEFDQFVGKIKDYPLVQPAIAPHSIYAVSRESTWHAVFEYADKHDLLIHVHLAETKAEEEDSKKKFGVSSTKWFEKLGLWKRRAIVAHGVYLSDEDIEILAENQIGVSHNPESNLKLGNAICRVADLRKSGIAVGLGTDGVASNNNLDLIQEADTAAKLQCLHSGVGKVTATDVVKMMTIDGARALGLEKKIGSLEIGKRADIIAVDLNKPHAVPMYNPYSHLVYSASGADIKHTIVDGKVLLSDYKNRTIDEPALYSEIKNWEIKIKTDIDSSKSRH